MPRWLICNLCSKKFDKAHHKSTLVDPYQNTDYLNIETPSSIDKSPSSGVHILQKQQKLHPIYFGLTFFKSVCDVVCNLSRDAGSRPPRAAAATIRRVGGGAALCCDYNLWLWPCTYIKVISYSKMQISTQNTIHTIQVAFHKWRRYFFLSFWPFPPPFPPFFYTL